MPKAAGSQTNRYKALIERIFFAHWKKGVREFEFHRDEIKQSAQQLGIRLPDNIGDIPYTFRYRTALPDSIVQTQPKALEMDYRRRRQVQVSVQAREGDAHPAARKPRANRDSRRNARTHALDDEQALLAIVRYNRLIDIFLGLTTYSLQNHLRSTVAGVGQIEIDELYIGLDKRGCHYAIPVQAKGGKDRIGVVQTAQDIRYCEQAFAGMRCRPIAAQFMDDGVIALFELSLRGDEIRVVEERHYKLVPATHLDKSVIVDYRE